ncbi:MAG: hypothetical protein A2840_01890 [Candidatus Buchananbacteria bacterium RIFCSPHIGHO2_01_FULL_47_11b]|uniref:Adenine DNA glycosylase n=1 Tax=Candidatus Buchananbacteria bacterium RIFCSPHIGHO2_01_FULL_47_11b TaxID=1797537 RepID=A0A1G1Y8N4_9BACT|nr:MAG: hypothetical protein A2840_01890 [Candidatus Buchananbacteria bacterium RIFCSPHIGHO2_01_FULL_47_11b]
MSSQAAATAFRDTVYGFYARNKRVFPWRTNPTGYRVLVAEIMLQQTQADRVTPKFNQFISQFPTIKKLARANRRAILKAWQGLGYNRRAVMLHQLAQTVVDTYRGRLPRADEQLRALPGVGPYTASAIRVFAFNLDAVLIETNIRSVYIDYFFPRAKKVDDKKILPLITETRDRRNPRRWYSALMDYGAHLKQTKDNPSRRSRSHVTQKPFANSNRQTRGRIVAALTKSEKLTLAELIKKVVQPKNRVTKALRQLIDEGLIVTNGHYYLIH